MAYGTIASRHAYAGMVAGGCVFAGASFLCVLSKFFDLLLFLYEFSVLYEPNLNLIKPLFYSLLGGCVSVIEDVLMSSHVPCHCLLLC
jgi:hypothetical protein